MAPAIKSNALIRAIQAKLRGTLGFEYISPLHSVLGFRGKAKSKSSDWLAENPLQ
jgi:hypothetical protein